MSLLLRLALGQDAHVLRPAGEGARAIAGLTWFFIALSLLVFLAVLVLLFMAARAEPPEEPSPERDRRSIRLVVLGGAVVPAVILAVLFIGTLVTLRDLAAVPAEDGLVIEVDGKQWWWEVTYRDGGNPQSAVSAANEIHIPIGRRIPLVLVASDVIHSFWVPGLQGKLDMIPGRATRTWLHADRPGVYRGACAEFCGTQHARMQIVVVAHAPEEFAAWLAREQGAALLPNAPGRDVFEEKRCGLCHAVRGTEARGNVGPDLTHVGSRLTVAAMRPNNTGNLAGWIGNPQALKPGSKMPRVPLTPAELHALVAWLEALE